MNAKTREIVEVRAAGRCEYCHMPQDATPFLTFHVEHIRARQHVEDDSLENIAFACPQCNFHKGPNLSSVDQATNDVVELFNPRTQSWSDHFTVENSRIEGRTPVGRVTARLLQMNQPTQVRIRKRLILRNEF